MNCGRNEELEYQGSAVSPMSRRYGHISAPGDGISRVRTMEQVVVCNSYMNSDDFSGYIFMCNGRTKPECYMNRVFALPAGRREVIEKIKPGMKLFLFDYDVKYLYGVYEATTAGRLNWEPAAFGGKFPAQVRFHIYKECLPLPESSFKHAIQNNYQIGSKKFNPILSSQQVSHLLSMFVPLTKPSSAIYDQYPVKDQFQSHSRLPPSRYPYSNMTNSSHNPQASLPPSYSSMYGRITSPALEPQYTQMSVTQPEHVGYGYAAQMGHNNPTVQPQANSAPYQTSHSVEAGQQHLYEIPNSYQRYEAAAQAVVPAHQYTDWRYRYNQLPSQTQMQMQETAAQHQSFYQVPAAHHDTQPIQQHPLRFEEPGPAVMTLPISSSNTWTLQI
ncbi:uncharacterized protein LOC126793102 [Argentina anserina]|uniref:uncharacterized protein LOC126793102 n=1 Tax=Argentina anserina TaxID=57926 RepID=UPI0021766DF6|nr:uncharacterized protein LOC126793102 [Potentilla anserina]XP_050375492.1 uncharacterized protein LOC126793102 [Potentilla anserina]